MIINNVIHLKKKNLIKVIKEFMSGHGAHKITKKSILHGNCPKKIYIVKN